MASGESGATAADTAGTWGHGLERQPDAAFQTGDGIGNKTVKSFTVLSAVAGSTGVTRSFNSVGTVVWLAISPTTHHGYRRDGNSVKSCNRQVIKAGRMKRSVAGSQ